MESTLNHAAPDLTDPRPLFARAIDIGGSVIGAVDADQLTDPTPCAGMNVTTMIGHLVGVLDRVAALGRGEDPFTVIEHPAPDHRWTDSWADAADRLADAWADDETLQRPMALPWIQGSGGDVLASYLSELTVHTWDLAVATGQRPDWNDAVVRAAIAAGPDLPGENRRELFEQISAEMGFDEVAVPFAEAVSVADDAAAIDRLVAWYGRDPSAS